jgi:membrane protease YdiL (CAAX protease family)
VVPDYTPGEQPKHSPPDLHSILVGEHGLRAGWRLALYLAVALLFLILTGFVASFFPALFSDPSGMGALFFQEIALFTVAYGAAFFMGQLEHRQAGDYGLPLNFRFAGRFSLGALFGLLEISLLVGLIALFGGYSFGEVVLRGGGVLRWAVLWSVFFLLVGLAEEFLFRGYTQFTLADGIGFWPAAITLSLAFGAAHLRNQGENWTGSAGIVGTGLLFAFVLRRTGNLWMAVGWHASFDFGETFLFSVPNSGFVFRGHLSAATLQPGPAWLTGGSAGPEASVFSFLILAVAALVIHKLFPSPRTNSGSRMSDPHRTSSDANTSRTP